MLVLSRNICQTIKIGDDIEIHILGIDHRGQVRIGIDAPKTTNVVRSELIGRREKPLLQATEPEARTQRTLPARQIIRRKSY